MRPAPNTSAVRRDFSTAQLKLIRRTVARACSDNEFDEFIAVASDAGLDPLRRQLAPLIVNADNAERRRLVPWTTIDGLRLIAARQGDYRPMEAAPLIERDHGLVDALKNPLGIARAEVSAWKLRDGRWYPVVGEAWWDEFAPLVEQRASSNEAGPHPNGDVRLQESWRRMGRVMIAKCAEAQALRRGWPDLLSGLYGEEELHALRLSEHTASELLQAARAEDDRKRRAKRTLWLVAEAGGAFQPVAAGDVETFVGAIYLAAKESAAIRRFDDDNRAALTTFWDWMPSEAFRLKGMSEALQKALVSQEENAVTGSVPARFDLEPCGGAANAFGDQG